VFHLNDVVSSDRHTVKPWFAGRLDFSPPFFDYSAQVFPLFGGCLDYLQYQTTAALPYGRAKYMINLFILPTAEADNPMYKRRGDAGTRELRAGHLRPARCPATVQVVTF
jgi:anti-sigma factor RsiW